MSTLLEVVNQYVRTRDLKPSTVEQLEVSVRCLTRFLGRPATALDFHDDTINDWLDSFKNTAKPATIARHRRSILALWRDAFDRRLVPMPPLRVRRIKNQNPRPRAWTVPEVRKLLEVSQRERGAHPSGVPWVLWWDAFFRLKWDSALRLGDVFNVELSDISPDGTLTVVQNKTGGLVCSRLNPKTLAAIAATHPERRQKILSWPYCRRFFFHRFHELVTAAGIRPGSSKWLRRSSATAVEAIQPGSAPKHLGHSSPDLAYQHYVDDGLLPINRPMPPEL